MQKTAQQAERPKRPQKEERLLAGWQQARKREEDVVVLIREGVQQ